MEQLTQQAIKAALSNDWTTAVAINKKILQKEPRNSDSLLRLAHAYFSLGETKKAYASASKALKVDSDNNVARKMIEKCKSTKNAKIRSISPKINLKLFVENGSTKFVNLVHLGTPSTISTIVPGESLVLSVSSNKVVVETCDRVHIGRFPDDVALWVWTNRSKLFDAVVHSVSAHKVTVVLHERSTP